MALHRSPAPLRTRILRLLAGAAATVAAGSVLAAGPAAAQGAAKGHLVLTVDGAVVSTAAPGQALQLARAQCVGRAGGVAVTVADVRAAFPAPFAVCNGVTLTSQVAAAGA